MSVYIGFSTSYNSWSSKIIRWATKPKVPISHVFIMVDSPYIVGCDDHRLITIGAEKKVSWIPIKEFEKKNTITAKYLVIEDSEKLSQMLAWLETDYWEADYEILGALAIGVRNKLKFLWRLVGRWWRSILSPSAVICTELVIRALFFARLLDFKKVDSELTDPPTLFKVLYKLSDKFSLVEAHPDVVKLLEE